MLSVVTTTVKSYYSLSCPVSSSVVVSGGAPSLHHGSPMKSKAELYQFIWSGSLDLHRNRKAFLSAALSVSRDVVYRDELKSRAGLTDNQFETCISRLKSVDDANLSVVDVGDHLNVTVLGRELRVSRESTPVDYDEYLESDEWRRKADKRKSLDDYKCQLCNESENLNVHHNTYERLGDEKMSDLVTLCQSCHADYHGVDHD